MRVFIDSGFINRPTYMPKEKFNEEKKEIGIRIQGLIAQGESITQMMEVRLDCDEYFILISILIDYDYDYCHCHCHCH